MNKLLKKIWDGFSTLLVIVVFCLALLLGLPRFLNIQPLVVLSGSMEPVYMTGSLVYVKEIETSQLGVGDVITFYQDDDTVVTHRIIEVVSEGSGRVTYRTKGDANEMEDAFLVPPENVIGEATFAVPYLGYLAQYIQSPPGLYIAIAVGAGLILLMFLPDLFAKEEKEEIEQKKIKQAKKKAPKKTAKIQKSIEDKRKERVVNETITDVKETVGEAEEDDDDILILNLDDIDTQWKPAKKQPEKKKRNLTYEEKRELAYRRKLYEERKKEVIKERNLREDELV